MHNGLILIINFFSNMLIILEVKYYQINISIKNMNDQIYAENSTQKETFWEDATKYTSASLDTPFVDEIAYVLVTLHRTGT